MLDITIDETMLLILTFFMRHNITKVALTDLLKLINMIVGVRILPESHYKFIKLCSNLVKCSKNYYCGKCFLYFGAIDEKNVRGFICSNCSSSEKKFFLLNSIGDKLQDIIKRNYKYIMDYKRNLLNGTLDDIVQGKFISSFSHKEIFSLSLNTDGVSLFASNMKKSLWPVIFSINELPPKLRYLKENLVLAGLWFDSNIVFEVFMKPIIEELSLLYENGIEIVGNFTKIICSAVCLDSVARCKILKMKQFNGGFGSTYCKHPGNSIEISGK